MIKTVATLFSGCVIGVVVAASWTGAGDLAEAKEYANKLEILITQHAEAGDQILVDLEKQKEIYRHDVDAFKKTLKEANSQTTKANEEIKKANEEASKHKLELEAIYNKADKDVAESTGAIMWDCDAQDYVPAGDKPVAPECPAPVKDRTKPIPMENFEKGKYTFRLDNSWNEPYTLEYRFNEKDEWQKITVPAGAHNCPEHRVLIQSTTQRHLYSRATMADGTVIKNGMAQVGTGQ